MKVFKYNVNATPPTKEEAMAVLIRNGFRRRYLDIDLNMNNERKKIVSHFVDIFEGKVKYSSIYLCGPIGVGKSTLLSILLLNAYIKYTIIPPRYVQSSHLFSYMLNNNDKDLYHAYEKDTILMIDDFGNEYCSDYQLSLFDAFIEYRYSNNLFTFITSNMKVADISKRKGWERIQDRMSDPDWIIELVMHGKSLRLSK